MNWHISIVTRCCQVSVQVKHVNQGLPYKEKMQVVAMSATEGNLEELSSFLEAEPITENFQPVKLVELSMLLLAVIYWKSGAQGLVLMKRGRCLLFSKIVQYFVPGLPS